ncbi:reverse transcriptase domain-containing protein [Tanacetum coccineum]
MIRETTEKIVQIKNRLLTTRSHQKSYADRRLKPLEFEVGDIVLLKVSPWKGTMRFGKRGKFIPRYIGLFKILARVGPVAYTLELPEELKGIHSIFHVSNLKKCLAEGDIVIPMDEIQLDDKLQVIEEPVEVVDREVKRLKQSRIPIVKVRWNSHRGDVEFLCQTPLRVETNYAFVFRKSRKVTKDEVGTGWHGGVGPKLASSDSSQTICEYSYALWFEFLVTSTNDAELRSSTGGYGVKSTEAENKKADSLSKLAAVQFDHLSKEVLVEVLNERFVEAQEKGILPEDPDDARTLMEKIRNYTMEDGVMYRKSYLVPLMRCMGPLQANYVIREVHMGSCRMHDGPRQVVAKAMNLGYYRPSMHRDAKELIRACDDLGYGHSGNSLGGSMKGKVWDPSYNHHRQWNLENGAVERANRSLLRGIKTRLEKGGSAWVEEVSNVLWAHRTIKKTRNGETPFSLTYGTEAIIPAEIGKPTHQTSSVNEKTNDQELCLNLDLLEEQREIIAIREARYKQQVKKYYNKKVRHVQFKVGEFVLRKNEASRAANTSKL